MNIHYKNPLLLLLTVLFVASCSSKPVASGAKGAISFDDFDKVVYFDFDRSEIKPEAYDELDANAEYIIQQVEDDAAFTVIIEGHTDESGTAGYNFALGNRRAESVARYLRVKGVSSDALSIESYGEERPAAFGSNQDAWAQNRRAEIVYP